MKFSDLSIIDQAKLILGLKSMPFDISAIEETIKLINPKVTYNSDKNIEGYIIPLLSDFSTIFNLLIKQ